MGRTVWGSWFDDAKKHCSKRPVSVPDEVVELVREWRPVRRRNGSRPASRGRTWTSCSRTLGGTKDLELVAARLGHSNEMLVLETYGHLLPGLDRRLADELGSAIKRPRRELREGAR